MHGLIRRFFDFRPDPARAPALPKRPLTGPRLTTFIKVPGGHSLRTTGRLRLGAPEPAAVSRAIWTSVNA
ncbi:hypothetical protein [Streptomyces sp. NPDC059452]|uniref:hypothetical protein n=1 Tax=Streptomyces sp. NPDC059452 TaxID=3346835 RepID=UPI0036C29905